MGQFEKKSFAFVFQKKAYHNQHGYNKKFSPVYGDVLNNWAGYVTGGLIIAVITAWLIWKDKTMPRNVGIIFMIGFLLLAFLKAWSDQKTVAIQLKNGLAEEKERNKPHPEFVLEVPQVMICRDENAKKPFALMLLYIKNLGTPSVAFNWRLSIKLSSESILTTNPTRIPDAFNIIGQGVAKFNQTNRMEDKTMTPIQQGGLIGGWLRFDFSNINSDQLHKGTKTLYVHDILQKEYSITLEPEYGSKEPIGSMYFPGSGDFPFYMNPDKK